MNILLLDKILTFIAAKYQGGSDQFKEDGGSVTAIPYPCKEVVICHPNLPESLKQDLEKSLGGLVFQSSSNFVGLNPMQRNNRLYEITEELQKVDPKITISDTPSVLIVTTSGNKYNQKVCDEITSLLQDAEEISLAYILWREGFVPVMGKAYSDPGGDIDEMLRNIERGIV